MPSTVPPGFTYLGHLGKGGQGIVSKVQRISDGKVSHCVVARARQGQPQMLTTSFAVDSRDEENRNGRAQPLGASKCGERTVRLCSRVRLG